VTATLTIRPEQAGDALAIHDLIARAFAPMPFSDGSEAGLVDALRADGDLLLSLVAIGDRGEVVGHIGFSPTTIAGEDRGWLQMAPVSVTPELQHRGIGSALIRAGLELLRERGVQGVAVVGNPVYYERFGFAVHDVLAPESAHDAQYFRTMPLAGQVPQGMLRYAAAFYGAPR
jgi:putative acetyltransferase